MQADNPPRGNVSTENCIGSEHLNRQRAKPVDNDNIQRSPGNNEASTHHNGHDKVSKPNNKSDFTPTNR